MSLTNSIEFWDPKLKSDPDSSRKLNDSPERGKDSTEAYDEGRRLAFTQAFMKLSGSVKTLLVPANDLYIDKKQYTWELVAYDQEYFAI